VELKKWAETVGISEEELEKAKIEAGLSENAEKTAENAEKTAEKDEKTAEKDEKTTEKDEKTAEKDEKAGLKRENSENEGTRKSKRVKK
jgi:hypothetical protein